MIKSSRYVAWALLFVFIVTGCASFPGGQLPKRSYNDITIPKERPSVDYDVKFIALGTEHPSAVELFHEEIKKVFANSNYFERHGAGIGGEKYHISFEMNDDGNEVASFVSGFISGLTFLIVPGYARDEYTMTAHVKKDGKILKTYTYKDHMDTWVQIFLIFLMPSHTPNDTARELIDGMLLNFIHDVEKDKLFEAGMVQSAGVGI